MTYQQIEREFELLKDLNKVRGSQVVPSYQLVLRVLAFCGPYFGAESFDIFDAIIQQNRVLHDEIVCRRVPNVGLLEPESLGRLRRY